MMRENFFFYTRDPSECSISSKSGGRARRSYPTVEIERRKREYVFYFYKTTQTDQIYFLDAIYARCHLFFLSFLLFPFSGAFFDLYIGSGDHPGQRTTFPLSRLCSFLPSNTRGLFDRSKKTRRERGRMMKKIKIRLLLRFPLKNMRFARETVCISLVDRPYITSIALNV